MSEHKQQEKNMRKLCIYHGNCADGFGAAWVVRKKYPDAEFFAGVYGNPPPDVKGREVIMVDFSYKRPVMGDIAMKADSLLVLDHHKTAQADLDGFEHDCLMAGCRVDVVFDMTRSGAGLAWDHFFGSQRPALIDHIEDRDLWKFKLDGTREIQANVFSYPYDFEVWDTLMAADAQTLRQEGAAIERKHFKDINEFIGVAKSRMTIGGHDVPCLNAPYFWSSDAGHIMAKGEPFAACYWDTPEGRVFSLRSNEEGLDVSEIARAYGGGGHRNASGFRLPLGVNP